MRARKRFAQHFLEAAWVNKLVAAVAATPDDSILEIGPGRGAITRPLAAQARRLLAVESRSRPRRRSRSRRDAPQRHRRHRAMCLSVDLVPIIAAMARCAAGTRQPGPHRRQPSLQHLVADPVRAPELAAKTHGVRDAMLMLQKEVADRLVARVGTGDYGVLTVLTALHADVTRVLSLPPGRVSACAQGAFRRRPPRRSGRRRWRSWPTEHVFVRMVQDDVHPAPEDDRECVEAIWR